MCAAPAISTASVAVANSTFESLESEIFQDIEQYRDMMDTAYIISQYVECALLRPVDMATFDIFETEENKKAEDAVYTAGFKNRISTFKECFNKDLKMVLERINKHKNNVDPDSLYGVRLEITLLKKPTVLKTLSYTRSSLDSLYRKTS